MYKNEENTLIERLKETMRTNRYPKGEFTWHQQSAYPPVAEDDLVQAEAQLGFALPSFLRKIYLEVGNGGFGPGYGLFPLNKQYLSSALQIDSLVMEYLSMRSMSQEDIDLHWEGEEEKPVLWPEQVLILCDWGCNIYSCLDCSSPDLLILRMNANLSLTEWAIEATSLQQWLEAWMNGELLSDLNWKQAKKVAIANLGKIL